MTAPSSVSANRLPHVLRGTDLTALAGLPLGPLDPGALVFVEGVRQYFALVTSAAPPVDGVNVIAPTSQAATGKAGAVWASLPYLAGSSPEVPFIVVSPLGGGLDDGPQLAAAYALGAATGKIVILTKGLYTWATPHQLPATGLVVMAEPGVTIHSTLPADGLELNAPFNYNVPAAAVTTLTAQPDKGSRVVNVVDASDPRLAPGLFVQLIQTPAPPIVRLGTYQVASRDLGLNTLTLDRPILRTFTVGSIVGSIVPCQDLVIYGSGMRITGTGDRGIEIVAGWHCHIERVVVDGTFKDFVCGYDLGAYMCVFREIRCLLNFQGAAGIAVENGEACLVDTAWIQDSHPVVAVSGLLLPGTIESQFSGVHVTTCLNGLDVTVNDPGNLEGCSNLRFEACSFNDNLGDGILVRDGAQDITFVGCEASFNGAAGAHVTAPVGSNLVAPRNIVFAGLRVEKNATVGLFVDSPSNVTVTGISTLDNGASEVTGNGGAVLSIVGGEIVDTLGATPFKSMVLSRDGGSDVRVTRCQIRSLSNTNMQNVETGINANLALDDCDLSKTGSVGILMQATGGGVLSARKVMTSGSNYPALLATGGVLHLDHETSLASGSVPQSRIDVAAAAVFVADAPVLPGCNSVAVVSNPQYLTWDEWHAGAIVLTGAPAVPTDVGIPPVRTRQIYKNTTGQPVTILAVDATGTPIGAGVAVGAGATKELSFDGTNMVDLT